MNPPVSNLQIRALQLQEVEELQRNPALLQDFPSQSGWLQLAQDMYGFPSYCLIASSGSEVCGGLFLAHVRHPLFGRYLVTAPFASYGGFFYASAEARDALLEHARQLGDKLGVDYVNIRFLSEEEMPPAGWRQHPIYATYLLSLAPDEDVLLKSYSPNHRNHIRKSLKKGYEAKFGGIEIIDDLYEGLARSMHELGSPYHSKEYLRRMFTLLANEIEGCVLYNPAGRIAGAGVFIMNGRRVVNLHANILRMERPDYAGEFLYWSAITRYAQKGFSMFDLGRSLIGSGNEVFKMKWSPERKRLNYWYYLRTTSEFPGLNQKNPKFRFAIWLWQRLPGFLTRLMGPFLIRGLA